MFRYWKIKNAPVFKVYDKTFSYYRRLNKQKKSFLTKPITFEAKIPIFQSIFDIIKDLVHCTVKMSDCKYVKRKLKCLYYVELSSQLLA